MCLLLANCVTTYDQYGRPVQTVDPVAATIGAVAIGAVAYSAGQNDSYYRGSSYCKQTYYSPYRGRRYSYDTACRPHYNHYYKRCR